jgi:hypothetical protein
MADASPAPRPIDAHDLRNYIERFIRENQHSRDVEHRWLADYAKDLMAQAYNVKAGNHDTIKARVNAFRLLEIEEEKSKLQQAISTLEKEEGKIHRQPEEAA